jgi:hypothetical protein
MASCSCPAVLEKKRRAAADGTCVMVAPTDAMDCTRRPPTTLVGKTVKAPMVHRPVLPWDQCLLEPNSCATNSTLNVVCADARGVKQKVAAPRAIGM